MSDLAGRRVLVTGGSRGIGAGLAHALAASGATVVAVARDTDRLHAVVERLTGSGHTAQAFDVSDAHAWSEAIAAVDRGGPLHGVVAAAGVLGPIGRADECDPHEFARAVSVNLVGTFLALHHSLPRLRLVRGAGVTFSGGGATGPLPRYDSYAASKAAVVRLTENIASVSAYDAVRVNAVAPGFVATALHEGTLAAGPERVGREYFERTQRELAAGGASLDAVVELVCFLLSSESAPITGKLLSAQWDPWRDADFRRRLSAEPDLATLRRIDDQFFAAL